MGESIGHLVMREERFMQVTMRAIIDAYGKPRGLKPVHIYVLDMIAHSEGRTVRELSDDARMLPSNFSPICRLLETSGLVRRERDGEDGRISRLFLTEEGRLLREGLDQTLDRAFSHAGPDNAQLHADIARGFEAFRKLVERAAEDAPDPEASGTRRKDAEEPQAEETPSEVGGCQTGGVESPKTKTCRPGEGSGGSSDVR